MMNIKMIAIIAVIAGGLALGLGAFMMTQPTRITLLTHGEVATVTIMNHPVMFYYDGSKLLIDLDGQPAYPVTGFNTQIGEWTTRGYCQIKVLDGSPEFITFLVRSVEAAP